LEHLASAQRKIEVLKEIPRCLHATCSPYNTGEALLEAVNNVSETAAFEGDVTFYSGLALDRVLAQAFDSSDYETFVACLDPQSTQNISLKMLARGDHALYQDKKLTKALVDLMRQACSLEKLVDFIRLCHRLDIVGETDRGSIAEELDHLYVISIPYDVVLEDAALEMAKDALSQNTTFKTHKSLTWFPTGQQLMAKASQAITDRSNDKVCRCRCDDTVSLFAGSGSLHQLSEGVPLVGKAAEIVSFAESGDMRVHKHEDIKQLTGNFGFLKATGSQRFHIAMAESMEKMQSVLDNLTEYILLLMRSKATDHMEEVLTTYIILLANGTAEGEQLTAAKAALSTLMSQGLSKNKPEIYAKDILPQEAVDSLQKEHAAISESFITLESMFDVFGSTNVLEMEATAAVHDLLEKPLPYMLACKPCSEFLKAAKAKLLTNIESCFTAALGDELPAVVLRTMGQGDPDIWK
jgi:hypothetical protein